jgi:hypothetical protein
MFVLQAEAGFSGGNRPKVANGRSEGAKSIGVLDLSFLIGIF